MKGTKPILVVDNNPVKKSPPAPSWLSAEAKKEWRRVTPILIERRILTTADLGGLENYCVCIGRIREVEAQMQMTNGAEARGALFRIQDKAMMTAMRYAAELGLPPVSRSRPSIRDDSDADTATPWPPFAMRSRRRSWCGSSANSTRTRTMTKPRTGCGG
jgi:P27 family predicted phage terminase small subunit